MKDASQFVTYVFLFLLGMVVSFLLTTTGTISSQADASDIHLEKISLLLQSLDDNQQEQRQDVLELNSRIDTLENKVTTQPITIADPQTLQPLIPSPATQEPFIARESVVPFIAYSARNQDAVVGTVHVTIVTGTGIITIKKSPFIGTDLQTHAKVAAQVAADLTKNSFSYYDYSFEFSGGESLSEANSLGAILTLGVYAAFDNLKVRQNVLLTGSILSDGAVGPVGNLFVKVKSAGSAKAKKLVVPMKQTKATVYMKGNESISPIKLEGYSPKVLNLKEYAKEQYGIEIVEIENVYDAIPHLLD